MTWYSVEVSVWVDIWARDTDEAVELAYREFPETLNPSVEGVYDPETGEQL